MVNIYRLMMDRHMSNNKGFTLLESLLVIGIICIISVLTLYIPHTQISHDTLIQDISLFINEAKAHAMVYKEKVKISFQKNTIKASSLHYNQSYHLKDGHLSSHTLTYNSSGNIINPKSVILYFDDCYYRFVFQIGAGSFYVE